MRLEKKTAVVTGGNRGIGLAVVKGFARAGARVYAVCRKAGSFPDAREAGLTEEEAGRIVPVCFDVRDTKEAGRILQIIYRENGGLDILVNNAGIMEDARIGMISDELIESQFSVNVYPVIRLTQLAARFMSRRKAGAVINMASIIGTNGNAGQSVYSAAKGAVIAFTKSAAKELAPQGIRVNAIAPGIIGTDLIAKVPEEAMEKRIAAIGLGRIGTPEEAAGAAVFLASDEASYITGQILGVDGGAIL